MNTQSRIIVLFSLIILLVVSTLIIGKLYSLFPGNSSNPPATNNPGIPPGGAVVCTMEAKLCPDGSYVGRQGPNCEFAACPVNTTPASPYIFDAHLNQPVNILGGTLTIKEIVEDSRCPRDVTCIQAGNVRIKVLLSSNIDTEHILTLNKPLVLDKSTIELTSVIPASKSSKVTLNPEDYTFSLKVTAK